MKIVISFDEIRPTDTPSRRKIITSLMTGLISGVWGCIEQNNEAKEIRLSLTTLQEAKIAFKIIDKFTR